MKLSYILFLISFALFSSCYYDNEEELYGLVPCDTTLAVSYSKDIVPLFQQQCYSCHQPTDNIAMGTYLTDKQMALNGSLLGSVTHASGYRPMPESSPKLSECKLSQIRRWINNGSPNN